MNEEIIQYLYDFMLISKCEVVYKKISKLHGFILLKFMNKI